MEQYEKRGDENMSVESMEELITANQILLPDDVLEVKKKWFLCLFPLFVMHSSKLEFINRLHYGMMYLSIL